MGKFWVLVPRSHYGPEGPFDTIEEAIAGRDRLGTIMSSRLGKSMSMYQLLIVQEVD